MQKASEFLHEEDAVGSLDLDILKRRGRKITLSLGISLVVIKEAEQIFEACK